MASVMGQLVSLSPTLASLSLAHLKLSMSMFPSSDTSPQLSERDRTELQRPGSKKHTTVGSWKLYHLTGHSSHEKNKNNALKKRFVIHTCVCWGEDKGLLKALAIIRLISTPVLFLTHIDLSHWIEWSGSVGFSHASSSSQMWSGGGGRINSGRKWPINESSNICFCQEANTRVHSTISCLMKYTNTLSIRII